MCKITRFKSLLSIFSVLCAVLATGCGTQPTHPNQLNTFDGASYDTLTLAHGALASLRTQVVVSFPKYVPVFNEAAVSYAVAFDAYALYRTNPSDESALVVAAGNLTLSIVALENSFQTGMQVPPGIVTDVRRKARALLEEAARQRLTVSDILTELEIAAALAESIPATSSYAGLASMVIEATSQALAAESAQAGQPIDLTTIQPIAAI
jgi:hypothetical protein